jgi:hypothetical protein
LKKKIRLIDEELKKNYDGEDLLLGVKRDNEFENEI